MFIKLIPGDESYGNDKTCQVNKLLEKYQDTIWPDLILSVGGDGTLLRDIRNHSKGTHGTFLGINTGTLGFLMNDFNTNSQIKEFIENPIFTTFNLKNIKVKIVTKSGEVFTEYAFNEVVLGGDPSDWYNISNDEISIPEFHGSGIVISTPQGSTGLNKSNGGCILALSREAWSITNLLSPTVNVNTVVRPKKITFMAESRSSSTCWVDGKNKIIDDVSYIEVSDGFQVNLGIIDVEQFYKKRI